MLYQQAPAGNRIIIKSEPDYQDRLERYFQPYFAQWYASGTSALAAAVSAVMSLTTIRKPEVLLPAYGCPDLVSAIIHAGAIPVLVDLEPRSPWMSLAALEKRIHKNTVAVMAVNLFGIPERAGDLRALAVKHGLKIIEDSAQYFPRSVDAGSWFGDYIILSFGRGKPVSLLHGGAVLSRSAEDRQKLPQVQVHRSDGKVGMRASFFFWLKSTLYNRLISPRLYWLPEALAFLNLGETRYEALPEISGFDDNILACLFANIQAYQNIQSELTRHYDDIFAQCKHVKLHPLLNGQTAPAHGFRLSRYPLLAENRALRDHAYQQLRQCGVGCSRMYQNALPAIPAVPAYIRKQGPFENAACFADCLLTLPLHTRIRQQDLARTEAVINAL